MTEKHAVHEEAVRQFTAELHGPSQQEGLRWALADPAVAVATAVAECMQGLSSRNASSGSTLPLRCSVAAAVKALVARRTAYAREYPIRGAAYPSSKPLSEARMRELWGSPASPVDKALHDKVRQAVSAPTTLKEALVDKEYRARGGTFAFPSRLDTFVEGLHRRTRDLHEAWKQKRSSMKSTRLRALAVDEMLLRVRWDDSDKQARANLSKMLAQIWDGLEGLKPGKPIPSALWLGDVKDSNDEERDGKCNGIGDARNGYLHHGTGGNDEDGEWSVLPIT